jgi:phosphodiesterase/alkaline phosphatase D-like protein
MPHNKINRSLKKLKAFRWLLGAFLLLATAVSPTGQPQQVRAQTFTGSELLGRPTDSSITVNVLADEALELYLEYGTTSGNLTQQTTAVFSSANVPIELEITGLQPNTRYYYRLVYREIGTSNFIPRAENTFHTQRARGTNYTFTI